MDERDRQVNRRMITDKQRKTDGWMDRLTDGRMSGWMDRQTDRQTDVNIFKILKILNIQKRQM